MFRLDSLSPELAESFRLAPPAHRRKATLIACTLAASRVGLEGEEVVAALEHLRQGGEADHALRQKLESLAAQLDDEYFHLQEEGDEAKRPDVLRLFSRARAASALKFALSEDSGQLHEALYEALVSVDDAIEVIRPVEEALQR
jgi:hypothetical protein